MKTFIKTTLILLVCVALTGCAPKAQSTKTEVEFWTLQLNDFKPYMNALIAKYEKEHPDIKIKWIDVPFSEGEKRVLASIMSTHMPDLVNLNPSFSSVLAQKGTLYDISELSEQKDFEDYLPSALDLCTQNGRIYCIPWYITSSITMYNQKITQQAQIKNFPTQDKDMPEFASQIKNKTGKYALMPTLAEDGYMLKNLSKQGIEIINTKNRSVSFDNEKVKAQYDLWKKLYEQGLLPKESITQTHREALEKYMSGELALLETGANFLTTIKDNAPEVYKNTKLAPQLNLEHGIVDFSMMNLIIPQKAAHQKEALEFALFLTNEKNQLEFSKLAPVLPSSKKALENPFFEKNSNLIEEGRKISANQLKTAKKNIPLYPNQKELNNIVDYATQEIILDKSPAQKALERAQKDMSVVLFK